MARLLSKAIAALWLVVAAGTSGPVFGQSASPVAAPAKIKATLGKPVPQLPSPSFDSPALAGRLTNADVERIVQEYLERREAAGTQQPEKLPTPRKTEKHYEVGKQAEVRGF